MICSHQLTEGMCLWKEDKRSKDEDVVVLWYYHYLLQQSQILNTYHLWKEKDMLCPSLQVSD